MFNFVYPAVDQVILMKGQIYFSHKKTNINLDKQLHTMLKVLQVLGTLSMIHFDHGRLNLSGIKLHYTERWFSMF